MRKEVLGGLTRDQLEIQLKHSENYIEKLIDENKSLKQQNDCLKNIFETAYIPESAESMMRKAGFSEETIDSARERIKSLERELKAKNTALKQHIKDMEDICDGSCFSDYEELPYGNEPEEKDALIAKLQDQHQQDCIRYTDMRIAYLVTLDELAKLREQYGVGR